MLHTMSFPHWSTCGLLYSANLPEGEPTPAWLGVRLGTRADFMRGDTKANSMILILHHASDSDHHGLSGVSVEKLQGLVSKHQGFYQNIRYLRKVCVLRMPCSHWPLICSGAILRSRGACEEQGQLSLALQMVELCIGPWMTKPLVIKSNTCGTCRLSECLCKRIPG